MQRSFSALFALQNRLFQAGLYFCKKRLTIEILLNKQRVKDRFVAQLIESAQTDGVKAFFRSAKRPSEGSSSEVPLHVWENYFSDFPGKEKENRALEKIFLYHRKTTHNG